MSIRIPELLKSWTVEPWAPDENYPPGPYPWSGTPTKVAPPYAAHEGFTPRAGVPAVHMNYVLNQVSDGLQKTKDSLTDIIEYTVRSPALNFPSKNSVALATAARTAFFVPKTATWWVVGVDALNLATQDTGFTWHTPVPAPDTADYLGGDSDDDGTVVLCTNTRNVVVVDDFSYSSSVLTGSYDCFGTAVSAVWNACIVYERTASLWCCVTCPGSGGLLVRTSPDGNTWAPSTPPASWVDGKMRLVRKPSSGRLVMTVLQGSGGSVKTSHSDDGGVTWSAATSLSAAGFSGLDDIYLAYDASADRWLLTLSERTAKSSCYASTDDGATWTLIRELESSSLENPACLDGMWVATASERVGESDDRSCIVFSVDDGVTWTRSALGVSVLDSGKSASLDTARGAFVGAGGFLVLTDERAYVGMRVGEPDVGILT